MLSIIDIIEDTTVDGPGFRTAIYAAGCPNKCPGCHNPESWDIHKGKKVRTEEIVEKVLADEFANVTALLSYIDVLVDGRYKQTLRDESLLFRGSSNQRLIDVQASLNKKEIVKYKYDPFI